MLQAPQTANEKATEASYVVSYHTALTVTQQPRNLSCAIEMARCMLDEKSAKWLPIIPFQMIQYLTELMH